MLVCCHMFASESVRQSVSPCLQTGNGGLSLWLSGVSVGRVLRSPLALAHGDVGRREGGSRGTTPSSARLRASSAAPPLPLRMAAFTSLPAGAELRHTNRPGRASPSLNRLGASCNACNDDWDWEREKPKAHVLLPMPTNGLYRPPNNGHFKGTLLRYFLEPCVDLEENCNPLHKKEIKNLYPPEGQ